MVRAINVYLDLIALVISLAMSASFTLFTIVILSGDLIAYTHDKTGPETMNAIVVPVQVRTGYDLLASLVNTDALTPYPYAIKIDNSPIIKLDSTFQPNKMNNIMTAYNDPDYGLKFRLDKQIYAVKLETIQEDTDGNGIPDKWTDYWHYYITTTP